MEIFRRTDVVALRSMTWVLQISGPSYADFHGFQVPEDCVSHLVMVHNNRGDFMQGFHLGRSAREHFLRMLGSVMNDIEHNFVDTVSTERILQWRAAI